MNSKVQNNLLPNLDVEIMVALTNLRNCAHPIFFPNGMLKYESMSDLYKHIDLVNILIFGLKILKQATNILSFWTFRWHQFISLESNPFLKF